MDRGTVINRWAYCGAQIVSLQERIPELEKQARKTPPKTLVQEWEKVKLAQEYLPKLRASLDAYVDERKHLYQQLVEMRHF